MWRPQKSWCAHSSLNTTCRHWSTDFSLAYGGHPDPAGTGAGRPPTVRPPVFTFGQCRVKVEGEGQSRADVLAIGYTGTAVSTNYRSSRVPTRAGAHRAQETATAQPSTDPTAPVPDRTPVRLPTHIMRREGGRTTWRRQRPSRARATITVARSGVEGERRGIGRRGDRCVRCRVPGVAGRCGRAWSVRAARPIAPR